MRAIIVQDKDAKELLDRLKLEMFTKKNDSPENAQVVQAIHRAFHYTVVAWLQEQGAILT